MKKSKNPTFLQKLYAPDDYLDGPCLRITKMSQLSWLRSVFIAYIVSHYEEGCSLRDDKKSSAEWDKLRKKLFKGEFPYTCSWEMAFERELNQKEMDELWRFHLAHSDSLYVHDEVHSLESKLRGDGSKPVMPVFVSIGEVFHLFLYSGVADIDNGGFMLGDHDENGVYALFLVMRHWSENPEHVPDFEKEWDEGKHGQNPWKEEEDYIQRCGPELVGRYDEIERKRQQYHER